MKKPIKVLLVDDEKGIRFLLSEACSTGVLK
jgi:hypothetical protein